MLSIQHPPGSKFTKQVTEELKKLAPRVSVRTASMAMSRVTAGATILPNYQKGTRLIKALAATEYEVEIYELLAEEMEMDDKGTRIPPHSKYTAQILGRRIQVFYSANKVWQVKVWRNEKAKTTEWEPLPKHIELAHELVHALRLALHTHGRGYESTSTYVDVTGKPRTEKVDDEESATIGLGDKNKEGRDSRFITENLLRNETAKRPGSRGRPRQRVGYEARDPVTKSVR